MGFTFYYNSELKDGTPFRVDKVKEDYEFTFGPVDTPTHEFTWTAGGSDDRNNPPSNEGLSAQEFEALLDFWAWQTQTGK